MTVLPQASPAWLSLPSRPSLQGLSDSGSRGRCDARPAGVLYTVNRVGRIGGGGWGEPDETEPLVGSGLCPPPASNPFLGLPSPQLPPSSPQQ